MDLLCCTGTLLFCCMFVPQCELPRRADPDACIRTAQLLFLMLISYPILLHHMMLWM